MARVPSTAFAILVAVSCAKAPREVPDGGSPQADAAGPTADSNTTCGDLCDDDGDGVPDGEDQCPDTPFTQPVNQVGCSDSQVMPELEPDFPPYGLTYTPTGDPGRAGGVTSTYTAIQHGDLFHIYWVPCDDPALPCGLSLNGPIDAPNENWQFSAINSDLPGGVLVLTNTTEIPLWDATIRPLIGRLTFTVTDLNNVPIPFSTVATLEIPARTGTHAAEILGASYKAVILAEVQDTLTSTWTPYLDYYDAAPTPDPGPGTSSSIDASFYDE